MHELGYHLPAYTWKGNDFVADGCFVLTRLVLQPELNPSGA